MHSLPMQRHAVCAAGAAEGTFWVVACCTDKSIRRFRVPMEQVSYQGVHLDQASAHFACMHWY
jgi:hypothetical protein